MTIGGIPEYLRVASGYSNYYQFIEREFEDANGYFYREPYFILSQKFREYSTYFSITNAISFGKIKPSEIAGFIGIENKRLYPYLQNLAKLMFISPSIPIDHRKGAGHYELRDHMIKFCFNYVFPNREFIERENSKLIFDFPAYFGRIFEDFIKNDVFGYLYPYYNIGTWWHKDTEIDIAAISQNQGNIVFCECKWKDHVDPGRIFPGLKRKAEKFLQEKNYERASYHIIAKSFSDKFKDSDLTLTDLSDIELIFNNSYERG